MEEMAGDNCKAVNITQRFTQWEDISTKGLFMAYANRAKLVLADEVCMIQ